MQLKHLPFCYFTVMDYWILRICLDVMISLSFFLLCLFVCLFLFVFCLCLFSFVVECVFVPQNKKTIKRKIDLNPPVGIFAPNSLLFLPVREQTGEKTRSCGKEEWKNSRRKMPQKGNKKFIVLDQNSRSRMVGPLGAGEGGFLFCLPLHISDASFFGF